MYGLRLQTKEDRQKAREFYTNGYALMPIPECDCIIGRKGLTAMAIQGTAARPTWHYIFKTSERMEKYISEYLDGRKKSQERKTKKAEVNKNIDVKIGDVFCYSWGYDQTNIDFYVVTAINGRMATFQECSHIESDYYSHGMACNVQPNTSKLYGEPFKKILKATEQGKIYISFNYGWCEKVDPLAKHYKSWYA
jgi:hypothetical protein